MYRYSITVTTTAGTTFNHYILAEDLMDAHEHLADLLSKSTLVVEADQFNHAFVPVANIDHVILANQGYVR